MTPDHHAAEDVVRRYLAAVNARDTATLTSLLAEDFDARANLPPGREPYLRMLGEYHAAFPDLHTEVEMVFGRDGLVGAVTVTSGTHLGSFLGHAPTGRTFRAQGIDVFGVVDGILTERWGVFDTFGMLAQLGLVRPGAAPAFSSVSTPAPDDTASPPSASGTPGASP